MTQNKEDYLNLIYRLGGEHSLIPNKRIADELGISPASVTEMLTKLGRDGLVRYTPYKGTLLTELGLRSCIRIVRSHRLWEVFLMRHLGYSWSEAHEDAHLLEHTAPPRLVDRLDRYLNYPEYCPHGSAIPEADGSVGHFALVPLADLRESQSSRIRLIKEQKELLDYAEALGIPIGAAFTVKSAAPYEGPVTIVADGREIAVSYKAAQGIYVESV